MAEDSVERAHHGASLSTSVNAAVSLAGDERAAAVPARQNVEGEASLHNGAWFVTGEASEEDLLSTSGSEVEMDGGPEGDKDNLQIADLLADLPSPNQGRKAAPGRSRLQHCLDEMLSTEEAYVLDLGSVCRGYIDVVDDGVGNRRPGLPVPHCRPRPASPCLTTALGPPVPCTQLLSAEEKMVVFGNLPELYELHLDLLAELRRGVVDDAVGEAQRARAVARSFLAREFVHEYADYCRGHVGGLRLLNGRRADAELQSQLQACRLALGHNLPLRDYLLKPVQRLLKYPLLLKEQLKCLERVQADGSQAAETVATAVAEVGCALAHMQSVADAMNKAKRRMELQSIMKGDVRLTKLPT